MSACRHLEINILVHSTSVYCNPKASTVNKNFLSQNFSHFCPESLTPVINLCNRVKSRIWKFEVAPIGYPGPWGKLFCEKNQKLKISCQTPFKWTATSCKNTAQYSMCTRGPFLFSEPRVFYLLFPQFLVPFSAFLLITIHITTCLSAFCPSSFISSVFRPLPSFLCRLVLTPVFRISSCPYTVFSPSYCLASCIQSLFLAIPCIHYSVSLPAYSTPVFRIPLPP